MTPITKAENRLELLKNKVPSLSQYKQKNTKLAIEKLSELIDLFTCRKRKIEKNQVDSLYAWFTDEFDIIYSEITEKLEGKDENKTKVMADDGSSQ